jgi:chemotaxis signal transduction protein
MYVMFTVNGRELIAPLDHVREIVRGASLERLPGCEEPYVGALQLRGVTVPVADARPHSDGDAGDVIVLLEPGHGVMGVLVERVLSVSDDADHGALTEAPRGLPSYMTGLVELGGTVRAMVDLHELANAAARGRAQRVTAAATVVAAH